MSMLIIDIETTGLKISTSSITVIGTILYNTETKKMEQERCFNVMIDVDNKNTQNTVRTKNALINMFSECVSIVAFNGIGFDMPFIVKWLQEEPLPDCVHVHDAAFTSLAPKYLDFCAICRELNGNYVSLKNICILNEIQVAKSADGAQAVVWAKAKDWTRLTKYCMQDVVVLLELTRHALEHGLLFPNERMFANQPPPKTTRLVFDKNFKASRATGSVNKPEHACTSTTLRVENIHVVQFADIFT